MVERTSVAESEQLPIQHPLVDDSTAAERAIGDDDGTTAQDLIHDHVEIEDAKRVRVGLTVIGDVAQDRIVGREEVAGGR